MHDQLEARTEAGRQMVALAERHAADFAARAACHEREGRFAAENIDDLRRGGYLAAPVPRELGGLGVDSVPDLLVAATRLARGMARPPSPRICPWATSCARRAPGGGRWPPAIIAGPTASPRSCNGWPPVR